MPEKSHAGSSRRRPSFFARAALAALLLHGVTGSGAALAAQTQSDGEVQQTSWVSGNGLYRLSFSSDLSPIQINKLHSWTVRLETMDGRGVTRAEFAITGGMPVHDHGLPTEPQVTRDFGNGDYLLEGVRFHMRGDWEIVISVDSTAGSDTVVVKLTL